MTTQATVLRKDLGTITKRLISLSKDYHDAQKVIKASTPELYVLAYQWITATVSDKPENVKAVIARMGKMLHMKEGMATIWYYCGKMMRENGIDYRKASGGAVYRLWRHRNMISEAEWRRGLDEVRAGKGVFAVVKILSRSVHLAELKAERRMKKLARLKQLTPKTAKMEAMALCTLARGIFKQGVTVKILDESGNELLATSCE